MRWYTEDQIIEALREECQKAGSQKAWSEQCGVVGFYVTDVLMKRRAPGSAILARLGSLWSDVVCSLPAFWA